MNEIERERSFPLFLLVSMALHALLFLFAPQLVGGLLPNFDRGEQGGVTLITLVDVTPPAQVRAAVSEAARQPRSRPQPAPNPEPRPQPSQEAQAASPPPDARPVETPQPVSAPTPAAQTQPAPVDVSPASTAVQVEEAPSAQPAPLPERLPTPNVVAEQPRPTPLAQAATPAPQPILTSEAGVRVANAPLVSPPSQASSPPAAASSLSQGEPVPSDAAGGTRSPESSGTAADQDVSSAAPGAEISDQPALPPTGESMVLAFGGASYPKDAVGLLQRPVTVRVAAIVATDGTVLAGVVVDSSGIEYIDEYAYNVATRAVRYRPHSDIYEVGVFVTFDPNENRLTYRVADFISVPPTVGSFAP